MERLFPRQGSVKMKEALTGKTIALQPGGALEVPLEGRGFKIYVTAPSGAK